MLNMAIWEIQIDVAQRKWAMNAEERCGREDIYIYNGVLYAIGRECNESMYGCRWGEGMPNVDRTMLHTLTHSTVLNDIWSHYEKWNLLRMAGTHSPTYEYKQNTENVMWESSSRIRVEKRIGWNGDIFLFYLFSWAMPWKPSAVGVIITELFDTNGLLTAIQLVICSCFPSIILHVVPLAASRKSMRIN